MNGWILVAVCLLIILIACVRGYRNGFLRSAFSMIALIVSIVLVGVVHPYVLETVELTPIPKAIYNSVYHNMDHKLDTILEMGAHREDLTEEEQRNWMSISNIPKWVQRQVVQEQERAAEQVIDRVSQTISDILVNILFYIFTLILIYVLIRLIGVMFGIVNYIPILGGLNRKLGIALGLVQGVVILWILAMAVTIFMPSDWGGSLIQTIEGNPVLALVYELLIRVGL